MATNIINNPNCETTLGNTGMPTCPIDPGIIIGGFLADPTFTIPKASCTDVATVKAFLQAATLAEGAGRIFPLPTFEEVADSTEEPKEETLGFGAKQVIMEGKMIHTWRFLAGGLWLLSRLRTFNSRNMTAFYYTKDSIIATDDGDSGMKGFSLSQFYAFPIKLNDGSKGNQYRFRITESDSSQWDNYAVMKVSGLDPTTDFSPVSTILGVLDIVLTVISSSSATCVLSIKTLGDKTNLLSTYDTEFANAAAYVMVDDAGGAETITSATVNGAKDQVTLGFSALGADTYLVKLANAAALHALGIGGHPTYGYESNTVTFTV
jgi:hypothetical protein